MSVNIRGALLAAAAVVLSIPSASAAYDFVADGIYYKITDSIANEVEVTNKNKYDYFACDYSGAIIIPDSVIYGDVTYAVTAIGEWAFYACGSLTSVELSGVTTIGEYAFYFCESLSSVEIPAGVESIEDYTFGACSGLKSVSFSENSKLSTIGSHAFYCTSLTAVTIPSGVTTIGDYAFHACDSLVDVYSINPIPPYVYGEYSFHRTTYRTGTLHVPATAVEAYAGTYPWSKFTNIVGDAESGIHSVEADVIEPAITARDGMIEVSGIDGGTVNVCSTSGVLVATGEAGGSAINVPGNGIYIVRINAGDYEIARKVAVR